MIYNNFNLVNYTNVLPSCPNEIYVATTEDPNSLAFLIKNNIIVEFSFANTIDE